MLRRRGEGEDGRVLVERVLRLSRGEDLLVASEAGLSLGEGGDGPVVRLGRGLAAPAFLGGAILSALLSLLLPLLLLRMILLGGIIRDR